MCFVGSFQALSSLRLKKKHRYIHISTCHIMFTAHVCNLIFISWGGGWWWWGCRRRLPNHWPQFETVFQHLKVLSNRRSCVHTNQNRHLRDKTWYFPYLNQVFFVPKSNWNISTALTQDKIENWTLRNVKLNHKECKVLIFILVIGLHQGNKKRKNRQ